MNKKNFVSEFHDATEAIEEAYEFMLAYAAQGRIDEDESSSPSIRELLENAKKSLLKLANKMELKDEDVRKLFGIDFENFINMSKKSACGGLSLNPGFPKHSVEQV